MSRVRLALATVLVVALAAAGCGGGSNGDDGGDAGAEPPAPPPTTGTAPPPPPAEATVPETLAFTVPTVDGGELDGADLAGTPVAFWFWAAWCTRCAAAAGDVREVAAEYDGQVHLVGVAGLGSGEEAMRTFVDQHQLDGFPNVADDEGQLWQQFGVPTREYFVILDGSGEVVHNGLMSIGDLRDTLAGLAG